MAIQAIAFRSAARPNRDNLAPRQLVCHWERDAGGQLICRWRRSDIEKPADGAAQERPASGRVLPFEPRRRQVRHGIV
jgi:hypothetical protein